MSKAEKNPNQAKPTQAKSNQEAIIAKNACRYGQALPTSVLREGVVELIKSLPTTNTSTNQRVGGR